MLETARALLLNGQHFQEAIVACTLCSSCFAPGRWILSSITAFQTFPSRSYYLTCLVHCVSSSHVWVVEPPRVFCQPQQGRTWRMFHTCLRAEKNGCKDIQRVWRGLMVRSRRVKWSSRDQHRKARWEQACMWIPGGKEASAEILIVVLLACCCFNMRCVPL